MAVFSSKNFKYLKNKMKRNTYRRWFRPGQMSMWWNNFCSDMKVSEEWRNNFWMSQDSFKKVCNELQPYVQNNPTSF